MTDARPIVDLGGTPQPDIEEVNPDADRALVRMGDAAYWLARTITGQAQPTRQTLDRWRSLIRVWAHRYPDRVTRLGRGGRGKRRYDLYELTALAEERRMTTTPAPGGDERVAGYLAQTGRPELTARQARRARHKANRANVSASMPARQVDPDESPS